MSNLSKIAKSTVISCPIMEDRTKIKQVDIGEREISIDGLGYIVARGKSGGMETVPVLTFAEDSEHYFFGGQAFSKIGQAWTEAYDGDMEKLNADLKKEPVKVRMKSIKTSSGNSFTQVQVL